MLGDQLKRWAATGLGLALLTKEVAESIVQDLVKQGEISREEGKELLDSLLARAQREKDELQRRIDAEVRRVMQSLGMVPQEELRRLEEQLHRLQARVERLEARLDQLTAGGAETPQEQEAGQEVHAESEVAHKAGEPPADPQTVQEA
ncbi:MAG TPA: hypothetical protein VIL08_05495 [Limnochorda sp.]